MRTPRVPVRRWLLRTPLLAYRLGSGRLLGSRFLQLSHTGRRSGRTYRTVLEVMGRDAATGGYLVMAGYGTTADWYRNVRAHPEVEVTVAGRRFRALARVLPAQQAVAALADYEARHRRVAAVIRRALSRRLGWRYTGDPAQRAGVVAALPVLALAPLPAGDPAGPPRPA